LLLLGILEKIMTSAIRHSHGNPTLPLPLEEAQRRGRLVLCQVGTGEAVWRSSLLLTTTDALRVDVWHGDFVGCCEGGCILPAGDYYAFLEDSRNNPLEIGAVRVVEKELFSADFRNGGFESVAADTRWHTNGNWLSSSKGISPADDGAYLFVDGEMHGRVSGRYSISEKLTSDGAWGLIARHYNGFNHLRVVLTRLGDEITARLVCYKGMPPNVEPPIVLDKTSFPLRENHDYSIDWMFNGRRHDVLIDGDPVLYAQENYAGGVTVVGLFAQTADVCWQDFSMSSTQPVQRYEVNRGSYCASVRPGNIDRIRLSASDAPEQNICWESGIQFGHIGGSEIKFTQGAKLDVACEGEVFSMVRWSGPMPKFVDQADDVRGRARGTACFYPDRIVLADYVLPWVRRSVGPDVDLFAHLVNKPARIVRGSGREFQEWVLPAGGSSNFLEAGNCGEVYPAAILFPLRLGSQQWWLKTIIGNLLHVDGGAPASMFAWRCPHDLVASHDFRVAPCQPGIEYGFSILLAWQQSEEVEEVEQSLLYLRDDWVTPMGVETVAGSAVEYKVDKEQPAAALQYDRCFNRGAGFYHLIAERGYLEVRLDPAGIDRHAPVFFIGGIDPDKAIKVCLDGRDLTEGTDFLFQHDRKNQRILILNGPLSAPTLLKVRAGGSQ
jgi:hypothetical protein